MGKRVVHVIVCIICLVFCLSKFVYAEETKNQDLFGTPIDYVEKYNSEMFIEITQNCYTGTGNLDSIDISNNGWFVLTFSEGIDHYIDVYNASGKFERQYHFKESGTILAAFSKNSSNIIIFPVRKGILIETDSTGTYITASTCPNPAEIIDSWSALNSFVEVHEGITYNFERTNPFSSIGKKFTVTDKCGTILFTYDPIQKSNGYSTILIIVVLVVLIGICAWRVRSTGDGLREP